MSVSFNKHVNRVKDIPGHRVGCRGDGTFDNQARRDSGLKPIEPEPVVPQSPEPGVSWHQPSGSWQARIYRNGKQHHVGMFKLEADAISALRIERALLVTNSESTATAMPVNTPEGLTLVGSPDSPVDVLIQFLKDQLSKKSIFDFTEHELKVVKAIKDIEAKPSHSPSSASQAATAADYF